MQRINLQKYLFRFSTRIYKLTNKQINTISEIYIEARELTKSTGVIHHVDHIKPLAAGGKHHPKNLQIITAKENLQKGANYEGKSFRGAKKQNKSFWSALFK